LKYSKLVPTWTFCIIHREALASRDLEPELHSVLQEAVKVVNFAKTRQLNTCLFAVLCEEMQADHKSLLLHSEVRWLSRGKVLKRLAELKEEVCRFLQDSGSPLYQQFLGKRSGLPFCHMCQIYLISSTD
jgi:hypothetical protein